MEVIYNMFSKLFNSLKKPERKFFIPGLDEIKQMEETPASKQQTDEWRFNVNTLISAIAAVASIVAVIVSIIALICA